MCGIIGTTNPKISYEKFRIAHQTIFHRGPDANSVYQKGNIVFGHSRLSILDLDIRSNQPFEYFFKDKKIILVFNGEIYNYLFLKEILLKKGYTFKTTSDTEVICAAYIEWGAKCFNFFEGMWAVALFDEFDQKIVISRDRIGKKPLYYHFNDGYLDFASSMWGVAYLSGKVKISEKALELYFALGFTPDEYSILEGVKKVMPGNVLIFKKNNEKLIFLEKNMSKFKNLSQSKTTVKDCVFESVKRRVLSTDVPIATLMSGGVDSTIVSSIVKDFKLPSTTFFVDFEDKKLSEFFWADYLSKRNKIVLEKVFLTNMDLESSFLNYTEVYEEPFADYSGIPSIAIFKKVAENFKVVLTGDGGDELFYGYPHYLKKFLLLFLIKINSFIKIDFLFPTFIQRILKGKLENFESNYLKNHAILTNFASNYINNRFKKSIDEGKSFIKGIIKYDREFNNLPEKYLVKIDRASMYSGVEARSPFLDERLLLKVDSLPVWKIFTPIIPKLYLKIFYFKLFGLKYFLSNKKGFTPPIKEIREKYFTEEVFFELKKNLKELDITFYNEIEDLTFWHLKKDKILFDRFFFFNLWLIRNYGFNVKKYKES